MVRFGWLIIALILLTGATRADPAERVKQIAVGYVHSCALLDSGQVFCWGASQVNGSANDTAIAQRVVGLENIKSISAGQVNSCAINAEDQVWCWGVDLQASIKGHAEKLSGPKRVEGLPSAIELASGYLHTCIISKQDGSVWC